MVVEAHLHFRAPPPIAGAKKQTASRTGATSLLAVAPHPWDVAKVLDVIRIVTEESDEDEFGHTGCCLFD